MYKINLFLALIMTAAILVSSCNKEDNSTIVNKTVDITTITGINLSIDADLTIIGGDVQSIIITGPENTVSKISTSVTSGIWNIEFTDNYNANYDDLDITITSSLLNSLSISGSGEIDAIDTLALTYISISGSGDIDAITNSTTLISNISGSGEIDLAGTADLLKYNLSGSGDLEAFNLIVTDVEITTSGSGDTEVSVSNRLDANISGSGDIYYKGNPTITQNISGSGKIISANK